MPKVWDKNWLFDANLIHEWIILVIDDAFDENHFEI